MPQPWRWAVFEKIVPPNCRRYYKIEIVPATEGWFVVTYHGRIGKSLKRMIELARSIDEAEMIAWKRARDRFLHEYTLKEAGR